jgi:hypothetical protein
MKHKLIIVIGIVIIITLVLVIPTVYSTTLGTFKTNQNIELYQICENCTYNNISTILYPNSTVAQANISMNKIDTYYSFSFNNASIQGKYIVNGFGDLDGVKTTWVYDFEITGTGFEFTESRSIFYIALLVLLVFLFVLVLTFIPKLPSGNDTDEWGMLMSINHLKYLRPVLYLVAWGLMLGVLFTSSNIALAYLGTSMFGNLLFALYTIMMWVSIPGIFIAFIFIFVSIFRDAEIKKMIERGVDIQSNI